MNPQENRALPWWKEIQVLWLLVLVGGIYFSRIGGLNLLGEETRRAQVAREMVWTGDWLVPRQQGELYLSRPPLGSWLIAIVAQVRGNFDAIAVRLPSLIAILLTTVVIYGYARNFLTETGAFIAAVSYPTMMQVLQLGRVAESESVFTLLLSGSLMLWHWGYIKAWTHWRMWAVGYVLSSLAGLTKGPQGIAYFAGPVWVYLILWERQGRMLFRRAHLIGLLAGAMAVAVWQIPFTLATSFEEGRAIWIAQAANRYSFWDLGVWAKHLGVFPLEVVACTCPWSLALVQLFNRNFWRSVQGIRSEVAFIVLALLVTFPTLWLSPHARGRYFMSLYPVMAVLCGVILEQSALANPGTWMNRGFRQFLWGLSGTGVVGGIAVLAMALGLDLGGEPIQIPLFVAVCFLAVAMGGMAWTITHVRSRAARDIQIAAAGLGIVFGFAYAGPVVSSLIARQPAAEDLLKPIREKLPANEALVSFGRVTHAFAYYYGEFIPQKSWPLAVDESLPRYFCCRKVDLARHPLPFAWEPIAEMSFEDDNNPSPGSYVIVARRLPAVAGNAAMDRK
jgi:4-amino-4-deoxy-L-arabinose transferase-like glycosyltransferase